MEEDGLNIGGIDGLMTELVSGLIGWWVGMMDGHGLFCIVCLGR